MPIQGLARTLAWLMRHGGIWVLVLGALGAPLGGLARSLADIRQTGELRVCVAGSSAPFYQANARAFATYLGVVPKVQVLANWDQQFHNAAGVTEKDAVYEAQWLADGRCDLFPNDLHMTDWRRTKMELVRYYNTRKMVVARRELRAAIKSAADLAGRSAAVQKGTAYESWLIGQNQGAFLERPVQIVQAPTEASMKMVAQGDADFTVIGAEAAFKWVRGDAENLDLLFAVDEPVEVGWGISPSAQDLRVRLAQFFADSAHVGSDLDRAWQRQYGISLMEYQLFDASFGAAGTDWRSLLVWLAPLGTGVMGVLLAMTFWARRLRREIAVHQKTELALRDSQAAVAQESARRLAVNQMTLHLQQARSLEAFARVLLSDLAQCLPVNQAIFCQWDEDAECLRAVAHYAGGGISPQASLAQFPTNGSLVLRCLASREPLLLDHPGPDYLRVGSGLGRAPPRAILVHPVRGVDAVCGVVELASLQPFTPDHLRLLADLEPLIALSLERFARATTPNATPETAS